MQTKQFMEWEIFSFWIKPFHQSEKEIGQSREKGSATDN